jgi:two-component system, OmpR family, sensor histidine kinase BaeS
MLRTLRNRLILSHILPILIVIPLTGVAIIYALETQVLLPSLSRQLAGEARLLAVIVSDQPEIWQDPASVQDILARGRPDPAARVMWLSPDGHVLASSDPTDADRLGQQLEIPDFRNTKPGEIVSRTNFSQRLRGEIVDVYAPVVTASNQVTGVVRMSYRYATVFEEFIQFRYLIAIILVVSLLAAVLLASLLALNISAPLEKVIQAVYDLARGSRKEALAEQGPEEIRQLSRSINHLMDRLHNLEEARRRLLVNLVHEIGRPLGALHASVQALLLTKKQDPQLLTEMLVGMKEETSRLQRLLDDLARLHDQVLGTLELERQPVNLSEWLPGVLRPWEAAAREKNLTWQTSVPSGLPIVEFDPLRLAQVVGNLVSNAFKFTTAGGSVSVTTGSEEGSIWIRVSDSGPGISAEELDKIFTPFYRGAQGRRIAQGMGLGLSIARDLVIAHEGRLEVESQPGVGSQFTIWLPLIYP